MGAYCKFCGQRCFVVRVIPDGPMKGRSLALATCQRGMEHDIKVTGHTHLTAVNPVTDFCVHCPKLADHIHPPCGRCHGMGGTCLHCLGEGVEFSRALTTTSPKRKD